MLRDAIKSELYLCTQARVAPQHSNSRHSPSIACNDPTPPFWQEEVLRDAIKSERLNLRLTGHQLEEKQALDVSRGGGALLDLVLVMQHALRHHETATGCAAVVT